MKKTLLLVDGSSYLYRAFHAMPDLRNAQGEPTGAIYGVVNMMRKMVQDYQAQYAACVFDVRGQTFREDLYPEYKSHRPPMPDDLALQIEPIQEAIRALGWTVIGVQGVEADDVIGTLAHWATDHDVHTVISTGDKDLAQLVTPHVTLVNTMSNERLDPDGVVKKFGVPPERIVDYLMLVGDTVDNVPGVHKVGPKTAAKWIDEYGSVDALSQHAAEMKGVAGQNLRTAIPQFALTRELLTIKTDCDLAQVVPQMDVLLPKAPDREALIRIYERYGFRTWLRDITGESARVPEGDARVATPAVRPLAPERVQYDMVRDMQTLDQWITRITQASIVALDTETTSLDAMQARLVGISLSVQAGQGCYIPVSHRGPDAHGQLPLADVLQRLKPWLEDTRATKVLHHAKYDTHVFANEGIDLRGVLGDTMLQAYVLESHRGVALHDLSQRLLGLKGLSYEEICGKGANQIGFDEVDLERATQYACEDADYTFRLNQILLAQVKANPRLDDIYQLEMQVSRVLFEIERNGVKIDSAELGRQSHSLGQEVLRLEKRAYEIAGQPFNLNSPKQLGEILFVQMQLPVVRKTAGGAPSTDEEVLTKLAEDYPLPQVLLEYRSLSKLKSTYTDKLPKMVNPRTGRVHTHYGQAAVITGRLASSEPNLQNIPVRSEAGRKIREAFVATDGMIVSADYSQIELRVMAHVSNDANLQKAFADGEDIHRATASEVFGVALAEVTSDQRRAAKAINFGLIYGMGAFGLATNLGITRDAAQSYIDRYFTRYPGVAQYMAQTRALAHDQGYVETVFGRRLWLPDINAAGARRAGAERAAINAPMQGTSADLIKKAMVAVQHWLEDQKLKTRMVMQVHDELVMDVPLDEIEQVKIHLPRLMCDVASLRVPLVAEVGIGPNWEQAH
jgi:DNA polymerase-1